MNEKPVEETFGNYLAFYRNQTRGENGKLLSQQLFAEAVNQVNPNLMINADTIFKLEKGTRKITYKKRDLLLAIIKALISFGGIKSTAETNYLVELSGLKALTLEERLSLPPYRAKDQYYLYESNTAFASVPKITYSGSYKKSQDPMNFSRVDSFYRSSVKQTDEDADIGPDFVGPLVASCAMQTIMPDEPLPLSIIGIIITRLKRWIRK